MRRYIYKALASGVLLVGLSSIALGQPKPRTVYTKSPKTQFRSNGSLNATIQLLDAGVQLTWTGVDKKQPQLQEVQYQGQTGFIYLSQLSPKPPAKEFNLSASGTVESMDTQSFARSAAAAKAFGEGALTYAEAKDQGDIAKQIIAAEVLSERIDLKDLNAHAKAAKLTEHHGGEQ